MSEYCKNCFELQNKIDELKAENERLKSQIKDLQIRKDRYYLKGLEQERQISDYITLLQEIKEISEEHINTRMLLSDKKSFLEFHNIYKLITKAEEG